jgi:hypothetical protein
MPAFNAEGLTYPKACQLINTLRTAGIDANIVVGGVRAYPSESQWGEARDIAAASGAFLTMGLTLAQDLSLTPATAYDLNRRSIEGD